MKPITLKKFLDDVVTHWPDDVKKKLSLHDLHRIWAAQYEKTPGQESKAFAVLAAIERALRNGHSGAEILDENSPIRDELRKMGFCI